MASHLNAKKLPNEKAKKPLGQELERMKSRGSISPFRPESPDEFYTSNYYQDLRNSNSDLKDILGNEASDEMAAL